MVLTVTGLGEGDGVLATGALLQAAITMKASKAPALGDAIGCGCPRLTTNGTVRFADQ